jgi:serine-threonine kinase receptor-associated protein
MPDMINSMELSVPTSRLVVCAGKDVSFLPLVPNTVPTHALTLPHATSSASLHPTLGDRFVAGSTSDPWVRVYDLEKGEEREVYKGHHGPVHCIEYSPDGEMYASGSGEFGVR